MVADARHQLDGVGQLDQVVVGPGGEGGALDRGFFLGRQDDDRHIAQGGHGAVLGQQAEAVDAGHHQVLEDDRRLDLQGHGDGLQWIGAEMEVDARHRDQRAAHRLTDHGLVIDQQDHRRGFARGHVRVASIGVLHNALRVLGPEVKFIRMPRPAGARCAPGRVFPPPRRWRRRLLACRRQRSWPGPGRWSGNPGRACA
ncbi:hypothetical protein D9M71_443500 [compost metagenome]